MVTPILPTRETLTGRIRGRVQALTGKVVLQVELQETRIGFAGWPTTESEPRWRDARPSEVSNQVIFKVAGPVDAA